MKKIVMTGSIGIVIIIVAILAWINKPGIGFDAGEEPFTWVIEKKTFAEVEKMYDWDIADPTTGELSILKPTVALNGVKGSLYSIGSGDSEIVSTIQWYRTYLDEQGNAYESLSKDAHKKQLNRWYSDTENNLTQSYGEPHSSEVLDEQNKTAFWSAELPGGTLQIAIYVIGTNAGYSVTLVE